MFDPTTVNSKILELTERKNKSSKSVLILANSVQVIEGFTAFEKPSKPKTFHFTCRRIHQSD